jgi:hypothetical protein
MSHVEVQILDKIKALLTGLVVTGDRVFLSRVHPLTPASMPGICIYLDNSYPTGGTLQATQRDVKVVVEIYVEGDDSAVSGLVLVDVEAALYGDFLSDRFFDGIATNLVDGGLSRKFVETTALKHTVVSKVYNVEYQIIDGVADAAN